MGQYKPDQNFTEGAKKLWRNPYGPFKYTHEYPDGDYPAPVPALTLLKHTNFALAPLGQTTTLPEIHHYSSDASVRAVIVDNAGARVLRHNFNTVDTGPDPISGQQREGNFTSQFNAGMFYTKSEHPAITYKYRVRLDDSYWAANLAEGPFPKPVTDGKIFMEDKVARHESFYLGFKNFTSSRSITIVSGNGTGQWHPSSGWCFTESYGWKHTNGSRIGLLNLIPESGYIMRSDGVFRTVTMEVKYNPGGIGYNLVRFKSETGAIYHDLSHGNTDENGWLPMNLNFEFRGIKWYSSPIAFTAGRQDVTTNPELHTGYAGGLETSDHWLYSGVED